MDAVRVLIAEDTSDNVQKILTALQEEFSVEYTVVQDYVLFSRELNKKQWDIVIANNTLPELSIWALLNTLRETDNSLPVIIIIPEDTDEDVIIKTIQAGASDYILRNNLKRLAPAVKRELKEKLLYKEHKNSEGEPILRQFNIINHLPDPCFAVDRRGIIICWNNALWELTGIPPVTIIGRSNHQYAVPFYQEQRPMLLDLFLSDNEPAALNYQNVKRNGSSYVLYGEKLLIKEKITPCVCRASAVKDQEGNIIGAVQSIHKLYENSENEILENEMYKTLFEQSRDIILIAKQDGLIIDANQAALETYGYSKEEITNLDLFYLSTPESKVFTAKQLERAFNLGIGFTAVHRRQDGRKLYVEISVQKLNVPDLHLCLIHDISERVQFQEDLKQSINLIKKNIDGVISALAVVAEKRDQYTAGHQQRVAVLAEEIAAKMGLNEQQIVEIKIAGLLHDIGKINIPLEILTKSGELSEAEMALLKTHAQSGYDIVKNIPFKNEVALMVLQHHERINGSGYPAGLKAKDILPGAKILAVADVLEAMSSKRAYRDSLGMDKAIQEIIGNKGILYDPQVVETCVSLYESRRIHKLLQPEYGLNQQANKLMQISKL